MYRRILLAMTVLAAACGGGDQPTELDGVQQIAYIERPASETGNIFEYTRDGAPTDQADIYLLSPPTASGTRTNLTHLPAGSDINAMDLSFDASEIVFSARLQPGAAYHLFRIALDGSNPCEPGSRGYCQITDGPNSEVYPIFLPGGRILFMTNQNVDPDVPQFMDEYERATTAQVATINLSGGDLQLGARNVSHRVFPSLMSDGRVVYSQWDHLGEKNEGNLMMLSQDLTGNREAFGKEGKGITNSYLRAREVAPGQLVAIGTSRDRTFQAGKIVWINLGPVGSDGKVAMNALSEANSSAVDLTPDVPADRVPSFTGVGRYYDVAAIGDPAKLRFLASWSDGPVETTELGMAGQMPSFGVYLYDATVKTRFPLVVPSPASGLWDLSPIPIQKRAEPPVLASSNMAMGTSSTLISTINVYDSTIFPNLIVGSAIKARVMEGFSSEEGIPDKFGLTEFDGHALLGEVPIGQDGSFKAVVPANIPVHIQLVDKFGMSEASEPIWIQGRAGEARVCGGCHEDRTKTPQLQPGSSALQAVGAAALDFPRAERKSSDFSPVKVRGVPWDQALQPIFDAHCVDCHDGSQNGANPTWTVADKSDLSKMYTFAFDLRGGAVSFTLGTNMYGGWSASHLSLLGPSVMFMEKPIVFCNPIPAGTMNPMCDPTNAPMPKTYVETGSAHDSLVMQMLNPPARYPSVDFATRAFGSAPVHPAEVGTVGTFNGADHKYQLSADEYYLLILSLDMGGQYYSRENAPGGK